MAQRRKHHLAILKSLSEKVYNSFSCHKLQCEEKYDNKSILMRKYCSEKEEKHAVNPFLNNPKIMLRCALDSTAWDMTSHFFLYSTTPDYTKAIMRKCVTKQQVMPNGIQKLPKGRKRNSFIVKHP